jgi:hypothetical protein
VNTPTILYRVQRPNQGIYFGIYDPATRRIRTERTEQAAAAVAHEMGLRLEGERDVTHDQWLRLTGIVTEEEIPAEQVKSDSIASLGKAPTVPLTPAPTTPAIEVLEFTSDDTLVLQQPVQRFSCFATESLSTGDDDDGPKLPPLGA